MEIGQLIFIGFCSLAAINAIFFSGYIWFKRDRNLYPNILLSLFMLITAYRIIQMLFHDLQDNLSLGINLRILFFLIPTFPLIGPLLYLYVKSISVKDFHLRITQLLHLLPFLIVLSIDLLNRNNFPLSPGNPKHFITYSLEITGILIQFLIYIILSYRFAHRLPDRNIAEKFQKEKLNPHVLIKFVLIISILWFIYGLHCIQTYVDVSLNANTLEAFFYSILSYCVLYYELQGQKITSMNNFNNRYKSSGLTAEDADRYKNLILDYLKKNELYKDHNVTLVKLAKQLNLTAHILSQVINDQLNYNFNDFINSYRIEEAKKMLKDEAMTNFTIASIAYECGFNTLSAFNVAFKKFTRVTPSQFRSGDR